ncbi:MAG: phosphate ABC transporter, permease protein PstA, partial [Gammaproteobacteria bacterium HGW-Gammaproteobacteria-8]
MAIWAAAGILFACAAWLMLDVAVRGAAGLDWRFLVDEPARAGRAGGI